MLHLNAELIALYDKYKDIQTSAEWSLFISEFNRFEHPAYKADNPDCIPLLVRCFEAIEKRYKERLRGEI